MGTFVLVTGLLVVVGSIAGVAQPVEAGPETSDTALDPVSIERLPAASDGVDGPIVTNASSTNGSDGDIGPNVSKKQSDHPRAAPPGRGGTAVLWRGFRHAWSYNHRFNRFGSWVAMEDCDGDLCEYEVGHAAASGSGEDKAAVREAYTELSASNVAFYADDLTIDLEGTEKKPDGSGRITRTQVIEVDVGSDIPDLDEYAVVLNGFDVKKTAGHSAKVIDFELSVGQPTRNGDTLSFPVRSTVLLDCDSFECKGPLPLKKLRGGKVVQQVDYEMDVHYLVGGDARAFEATTTDPVSNDYAWDACLNNKVENPFTSVEEDDDWGSNVFLGNHMNCERSTDPDGTIERYEWRLSNGARSVGPSLEFAFGRPGVFDVTLVVVDDDGAKATVTKTVSISETDSRTQTSTATPPPTTGSTGTGTPTETARGSTATESTNPDDGTGTIGTTSTATTHSTIESSPTTGDTESPPSDGDGNGVPTPGFGPIAVLFALSVVVILGVRRTA